MSLFISISSASSDIKDSPITEAITRLAAAVAKARASHQIPSGPSLDVTFLLPGKFEKPNFSGMRMGGYSDSDNILFFEKAVPDHIIFSPQADEFLSLVMQDVVSNAHAFFNSSERDFDLPGWELLAREISPTAESSTLM